MKVSFYFPLFSFFRDMSSLVGDSANLGICRDVCKVGQPSKSQGRGCQYHGYWRVGFAGTIQGACGCGEERDKGE